jgi:hypothetical protein
MNQENIPDLNPDRNVVEEPINVVTPQDNLEGGSIVPLKQNNSLIKQDGFEHILVVNENEGIKETHFQEGLSINNSDDLGIANVNKNSKVQPVENNSSAKGFYDEKFTFEDQKIKDLVAQVHALQEDNIEVTEADIDALLLKAQKEITLKRLHRDSGSIDALALLESVEQELDQSFRNKVLEALKTSYNSVKTAVAQRQQ